MVIEGFRIEDLIAGFGILDHLCFPVFNGLDKILFVPDTIGKEGGISA